MEQDVNFDPNDISITPSDWFRPNVVYGGRGRAEFEDPGKALKDRPLHGRRVG
jgi:hypothetical protein